MTKSVRIMAIMEDSEDEEVADGTNEVCIPSWKEAEREYERAVPKQEKHGLIAHTQAYPEAMEGLVVLERSIGDERKMVENHHDSENKGCSFSLARRR